MKFLLKGKSKFFYRFVVFVLTLLFVFSAVFTCSAEKLPYDSYRFENSPEGKDFVTDKPMYKVSKMLSGVTYGIGTFSEIGDMFTASDNKIYILDSGNGRIIVLDSDYSLSTVIDKFTYKNSVEKLAKPQGLFVKDDGTIYIADTENSRVLLTDNNGQILRIITLPKSDLIPEKFDFYPIRIISDNNGFLYVLTRGSYYGAMLFDADYSFIGFFGANTVVTSVLDGISAMFSSIFETNAKLAVSAKKLPYQFSDFDIDRNGFFYTVSNNDQKATGQVRKLNLAGNDILKYNDGESNNSSVQYNFGETKNYFDKTGRESKQLFCSISVDDDGYIFTVDNIYGKIYEYDSACNSITVFGGGMSKGSQKGVFSYPTAVENNGTDVFVADAHTNEITVFSLTEYGRLVRTANNYTLKNDHTNAVGVWKEVLRYCSTSTLAYSGLTKAALSVEDYPKVFDYSKKANDKESYAIAFDMLKKEYIANNLWWIILIIIVLIVGTVLICKYLKKKDIVIVKNIKIRTAFNCLIHPFDSFAEIKYKKLGSPIFGIIVLVLFYVSSIGQNLWCGFMYSSSNNDFNVYYTLLGTIGVALLWVVVEWAVTTLFHGKGKISEIFHVTCYSLMPVIIFRAFYIVYSYLFSPTGTSFLGIISTVFVIYSAVLLVVGLITVHEYSLGKVAATSLLTVIGMMIVAFVAFMMMSLFQNFLAFIVNVISEIIYK